MKTKMAVVGIVLIVAGILLSAYFFGYFELGENNELPKAKIEINSVVGDTEKNTIVINIGDSIFFNANNSSDIDGEIKTYNWNFGDGHSETGILQAHAYSDPGYYNVTLIVIDDDGAEDVTWLIIRVNTPPITKAEFNTNATQLINGNVLIYDPVYFLATNCCDPDGAHYDPSNPNTWPLDLEYFWEFGDGNTTTSENPTHSYNNIGTYTLKLTTTDSNNAKSTDSFKLEIILRTYAVIWLTNNGSQQDSGYTTEFMSTEGTYTIDPPTASGLSKVVYELEWTDRLPVLNASAGPDEFELSVTSPEDTNKVANGTNEGHTGKIVIIFDMNPTPKGMNISANNKDSAKNLALTKCSLTTEGIGVWLVNITAVNCEGWELINGKFGLDMGNDWDLKITYFYYVMEVAEIDYY